MQEGMEAEADISVGVSRRPEVALNIMNAFYPGTMTGVFRVCVPTRCV